MAQRIEIYPSGEKYYRWRCRAPNGQIVATGHQRFANKANAKRGARTAATIMRAIAMFPKQIVDMEKKKKKRKK